MSLFLLPKSLCGELENIISRLWWQKRHGRKGIHWCQWAKLCELKENGGLGFHCLNLFNIAVSQTRVTSY